MKKYTFEIIINQGYDEWWEKLIENKKTGCEEILQHLEGTLDAVGFDAEIKLIKYEDN